MGAQRTDANYGNTIHGISSCLDSVRRDATTVSSCDASTQQIHYYINWNALHAETVVVKTNLSFVACDIRVCTCKPEENVHMITCVILYYFVDTVIDLTVMQE